MNLPNGFDRADGEVGEDGLRFGTATPPGAVLIQSQDAAGDPSDEIPIEESPDSPTIERAEQATIRHSYTMSWEEAKTQIAFYGRGTILTDESGNITKVLSASIQHQKGGSAILNIVTESVSFDSPPDEFRVDPIELGLNIIKHPRYYYAFLGDGPGSDTEILNQMVIRRLQDYMENPTSQLRDAVTLQIWASLTFTGTVDTTTGTKVAVSDGETLVDMGGDVGFISIDTITGTDMAKRAALEIIQKFWRGEETPYVVGWQITWSQYYFRPQFLNPGGYVENPINEAEPQLPAYFFSPDEPGELGYGSVTIFDALGIYNPQCYSVSGTVDAEDTSISWLRKADDVDWQRTWFKVTRTWIGSPIGMWDEQLYNQGDRPQYPEDYEIVTPASNPSFRGVGAGGNW